MAEIVRSVNLPATFASLKKGDTVEISFQDATESNVRTAAHRYAREKNIDLKVSAPRGAEAITVTRRS